MNEINFYQIDDVIVKSMAPLLLKILEEKKNTLIYAKEPAKMAEIDGGLWQFSKTKFVAHATNIENDIDLKIQPFLITNEEKNENNSQYLVLTENCSLDFLINFSRIFYFYDSMTTDNVKKFKNSLGDSFQAKSYKKIAGKWEEFSL